jgi:hypothetical protein
MGDRVGVARLNWAPELGGKITSLRFAAAGSEDGGFGDGGLEDGGFEDTGREWLAPPVRARAVPRPGQDWGELDCSGWDECLPNIGAAPGAGLSDHGDVWRTPWTEVSGVTPRTPAGTAAMSGHVSPPHRGYSFARDITSAAAGALRIDYRLKNLGAGPLRWAWAQHMLLAADERTRIAASSPMHLRVDALFNFNAADVEFESTSGIELGKMVGRAAKLWLEPPLPAVVAVLRDADWLAWRVADSSFPHLGLWINLGGWGDVPLRHVAVEPAFGAHDDPADAYADLDPLAPGDEHAWSVLIQAGSGLAALEEAFASTPSTPSIPSTDSESE